jgi:hypothetical protein
VVTERNFKHDAPWGSAYAKSMSVIDARVKGIFEGRHFVFSERVVLGVDGVREYLFETPSNGYTIHFWADLTCVGQVFLDFFEDTEKAGGTALSIVNRNRESLEVCNCTLTHTPSGTGDGTKLREEAFGSPDATPSKPGFGGNLQESRQFMLKSGTNYLLRITSKTDANTIGVLINTIRHDHTGHCYWCRDSDGQMYEYSRDLG